MSNSGIGVALGISLGAVTGIAVGAAIDNRISSSKDSVKEQKLLAWAIVLIGLMVIFSLLRALYGK